MCYTSGTTGNPKGVLYSHRSNVLHAIDRVRCPTPWASSSRDVMLPVVPMFHANCWALAFSAPMTGAKLVMPGAEARRRLDLRTARHDKVTFTAGGADGLADAAAAPGEDRRASCRT